MKKEGGKLLSLLTDAAINHHVMDVIQAEKPIGSDFTEVYCILRLQKPTLKLIK